MRLADATPPLDPSTEQARAWLEDELATARYHVEPSLLDRFSRWLASLLDGGSAGGPGPGWVLPTVLALVAVVVLAIILRVMRTDRVVGGGRHRGAVLDGITLSAQELRARAEAAAERSDWNAATLDAFRALVVRSADRTLLDNAPSQTAVEAAYSLARAFPVQSAPLRAAARAFDDVLYGHLAVSRESALEVLALDRRLEHTVPDLSGAVTLR